MFHESVTAGGLSSGSAEQGVEDDHLRILCMGGRTVSPEVAWDLVRTYVEAV